MGFIINADLETSQGSTHHLYGRIESLNFNRVTMEIQIQLSYWESIHYAINSNIKHPGEKRKSNLGLVQERVIYYENNTSEGVEIMLPHYLTVPLSNLKEVEVPIYEIEVVETQVPYVSFDENGEEITKTRILNKEVKNQIGTELQSQDVIDYNILSNLFEFSYKSTIKYIGTLLPAEKIESVFE